MFVVPELNLRIKSQLACATRRAPAERLILGRCCKMYKSYKLLVLRPVMSGLARLCLTFQFTPYYRPHATVNYYETHY